jgi:hypothetical protein
VLPNSAFPRRARRGEPQVLRPHPFGADVVIAHGATYGTLDKRHILDSRFGCKDLSQAVLRVRPKLHVFAHLHYRQEGETERNRHGELSSRTRFSYIQLPLVFPSIQIPRGSGPSICMLLCVIG